MKTFPYDPNVPFRLEQMTLVLAPRKGWTLASLFTEFVCERYGNPANSEEINAKHLHLIVDAKDFPYHDIVDFRQRLPSLQDAGKVGKITLNYTPPTKWTQEQLESEIKRAMRTLDRPDVQFTDQLGSLLVHQCLVDLVIQLNEQLHQTRKDLEVMTQRERNVY